MAITPIVIRPRQPKGPSALEKVALAFEIASKALGLGLAVPKFMQEKEQTEATQQLAKQQADAAQAFRETSLDLRKSGQEAAQNRFEESQKATQKRFDIGETGKRVRAEQSAFNKRFDRLEDDIEKVEKFYKERILKSEDALQQAKAGTSISASAAAVAFGRASGDQRISNEDIKRYMPKDTSVGIITQIGNWIRAKADTPLSAEINQALVEAIDRSLQLSKRERVLDLADVFDRASIKKDFWNDEEVQDYYRAVSRKYKSLPIAIDTIDLEYYIQQVDPQSPEWGKIKQKIDDNYAKIGN